MSGAEIFQEPGVNEHRAGGAIAGNVVEIGHKRDVVYCPECGSDKVYRIERTGFLQRRVFPMLGFYPWVCKECGREELLRKRNRKRRKHPPVA
jgi:predicted RNA-binding Zn-ribbon protein involved in translation (DUF1610 family)